MLFDKEEYEHQGIWNSGTLAYVPITQWGSYTTPAVQTRSDGVAIVLFVQQGYGSVGGSFRISSLQQQHTGIATPGQDNTNAIASVTLPTYAYRYGFNGQERENEINPSVTTAQYWEYDGRLGRRWNVDPVLKPWRSPYDAFRNCPLLFIDPQGDDDYYNEQGKFIMSDNKTTNYIRVINVTTEAAVKELVNEMINGTNDKDLTDLNTIYAKLEKESVGIIDVSEATQKLIYDVNYSGSTLKLLEGIIESEKGVYNGKTDPGGLTNYGIAKTREWSQAAKYLGVPELDANILKLTKTQALHYYAQRLEVYRIVEFNNYGLQIAVLDQSVLTPGIINKNLKSALNSLGYSFEINWKKLNDEQIKAINSVNSDALTNNFLDEQMKHYENIKYTNPSNYYDHIKGWRDRVNKLRPEK